MEKEIDIDDLSFNLLPKKVRVEAMRPHLIDPFNIPEGTPLMNPFTYEVVNGVMKDGVHTIRNPFKEYEIRGKVLFESGKAVKAWKVNDNNELEETFKQDNTKYWE